VGALFFLGCGKAPTSGETPVASRSPQTDSPMPVVKALNPDLGWTVANAHHVRLADSKDKVIVLDFYATWCEPCRYSIPHLVDLQKRYGPQGLQIVGLNVGGPEDVEQIPSFAREFRIQYQLGIPDAELEDLMSDQPAIPQTFVIDRHGVIFKRFVGYDDSMGAELESAIQTSLATAK
jgi:cytochrome c biogenesis protein CcmG/thiol:disulfide interchange protein DsbE